MIVVGLKEVMVKVKMVLVNLVEVGCRKERVYKECVEFVWSIEMIGVGLVGSIGDVLVCELVDGCEDGMRGACRKGRMIGEMGDEL